MSLITSLEMFLYAHPAPVSPAVGTFKKFCAVTQSYLAFLSNERSFIIKNF